MHAKEKKYVVRIKSFTRCPSNTAHHHFIVYAIKRNGIIRKRIDVEGRTPRHTRLATNLSMFVEPTLYLFERDLSTVLEYTIRSEKVFQIHSSFVEVYNVIRTRPSTATSATMSRKHRRGCFMWVILCDNPIHFILQYASQLIFQVVCFLHGVCLDQLGYFFCPSLNTRSEKAVALATRK